MAIKNFLVRISILTIGTALALPQVHTDVAQIVGGEPALEGEFPFIVNVEYDGTHHCGGSLLNANTVVLAAHCLTDRTISSFTVRAGSLVSYFSNAIARSMANYKAEYKFRRHSCWCLQRN